MEEAMIPVFSVLKKGTTLKNIFLNTPPPGTGNPLSASADHDAILIGRHPNCHIVLDHPSISRFHLEIFPKPTLQKLFVTDRSSVHGTWISGKKIQPNTPIELSEGDTLRLGASTRTYHLHWMPLSRAFEMEKPMSTLLEEPSNIMDNCDTQDENSNEVWFSHVMPSAPPIPEILKDPSPEQLFAQGLGIEGQSLVMEEMLKQSSCFSSIAPFLESVSTSWPLENENGACESLFINLTQPEGEGRITLRSDQKAKSSSLLSRRNKSISFLEIERNSKENTSEYKNDKEHLEIGEELVGAFAGGNIEESSFVYLAEIDVKEDEGESFVSDKENMTPINSVGSKALKSYRCIERSALSSFSLFHDNDLEIDELKVGPFERSGKDKIPSGFLPEGDVTDEEERAIFSDKANMAPANSNGSKVLKSNQEIERSPLGSYTLFNKENLEIERHNDGAVEGDNIPLVLLTEGDVKEEEGENFSSRNENLTLENSIDSKRLKSSRKIERSPLRSFSICDEEHSDSGKDNRTSETIKHISNNLKLRTCLSKGKDDSKFSNENNFECLFSPGVKLQRSLFKSERSPLGEKKASKVEENTFFSDIEKTPKSSKTSKTRKTLARDHLKAEIEENEAFVSDKENLTPLNSMCKKLKNVLSESLDKPEGETMKRRKERIPFQPLFENSPIRSSSPAGYVHNLDDKCCNKYANNFQNSEEKTFCSQYKEELPHLQEKEKKKWYIVVDVGCFLNEESRKSLQLLEGIRGTQLIIPRIVIRELDHLKRCQGILSRGTKASSILQWIEECMVKSSWWIHVQSTTETFPAAPTPPATPRTQLCDGTTGFGTVPSNFTGFSTCGSLMEIVSPTAEDHILDCALLFKRIRSDDGQIMLLTSSTTLKIKAMAEGLLCETPKEFRESLVNPFSKRFLWTDSSPRGSTWSCLEEVLAENCRQQFTSERSTPKAEGAVRGLKLILLHSSYFGTLKSIH